MCKKNGVSDEQYSVYNRINELAKTLVTLDYSKDKAAAEKIKNEIAEKMLGTCDIYVKHTKGKTTVETVKDKVLVPLIYKKRKILIHVGVLHEVLTYLLSCPNNTWTYDPKRGKFTTALFFYVVRKEANTANEYFERVNHERNIGYEDGLLEDTNKNPRYIEEDDAGINREENAATDNDGDSGDETDNGLLGIGLLSSVIRELTNYLNSLQRQDEAKVFKAFFSHDITKVAKDSNHEDALRSDGDRIFRILLLVVLEYLMTGRFNCIDDVIANRLKSGIRLSQRQDNIEKALGVSHPTANKYSKKYTEICEKMRAHY